ncbi:MAG: dihydroorotate dehydrogenase [Symbiobacterium thermophilum]|uniref:Dihydroorotate dehydrogenase n=1 Tax=Symbiobacterium thermophilum TaxID=2734 RepID=A0A953LHH4_SYMTR|nr:dihydroorotate dehydrogenase [Symbiobacterium thermophilum]
MTFLSYTSCGGRHNPEPHRTHVGRRLNDKEVWAVVLVIGGDHLGSIDEHLRRLGYRSVKHVTGRSERRVEIPSGTELVVVLIDYVNHNLARWVKQQAKARGLPIIFSRRSWSSICASLRNCEDCPHRKGCLDSSAAS